MSKVYCTLFDHKYLTRGLAMCESLHKHEPEAQILILAMDDVAETILRDLNLSNTRILNSAEFFHTTGLAVLKSSRPWNEFCWTCTPFLLEYCLRLPGVELGIYVDADVYFFGSPDILLREFHEKSDVLLTEHRFSPGHDQVASSGRFCVQFLPIRNTHQGIKILSVWKQQCYEDCSLDSSRQKCGDQKYLDEWPQLYSSCQIVRSNGALGPWNIESFSPVKAVDGRLLTSSGEQICFYHFHGLKFYQDLDYDLTGSRYRIDATVFRDIYRPYIEHNFRRSQDPRLALLERNFVGFQVLKSGSVLRGKLKKAFKRKGENFRRNLCDDFDFFHCPVCKSSEIQNEFKGFDDRHGFPNVFSVLGCRSCAHRFLFHQFSSSDLGNLYGDFYPRANFEVEKIGPQKIDFGWKGWLNGDKSAAAAWVPAGEKVLDVGCGFAEGLLFLRDKSCQVFGVDADRNVLRIAEKLQMNLQWGLLTSKTFVGHRFQYILLNQVIEHVVHLDDFMNILEGYLEKSGKMIITTPNVDSIGQKIFRRFWIHWHIPYHLQFFSQSSMRILLHRHGFVIEKELLVTPSAWLLFQLLHMVNYPRPGQKSAVWNHGQGHGIAKMLNLILKVFYRTRILHLLARAMDFLGLGDNKVYIVGR